MTVYVVIVSKEECKPNCYVYAKEEDAIKLFNYYKGINVPVTIEEQEVREKY